jgi:O-acetylserine/cysteine efflux transporter
MKPRDAALLLMVMLIWGLNFVFAKWAFVHWPPILVTAARFLVTAAVLLPFARVPRGRFGAIAALSVTLGTVHFSLMFTGVSGTDAGVSAILALTQVPFAGLIAWLMLGDAPGWRSIAGQAVAFAGVVVLAGEPRVLANPGAAGLVIAASFMWAVAAIQVKRMAPIDAVTLNGWMSLFAVPQLLIVSSVVESGQVAAVLAPHWIVWVAVLYMALGVTVVGYVIWYRMLVRYPVNLMMAFTLLVPVFGVASGHLFLGEPIGWQRVGGGLITILGVAIIVVRRPQAA